MRPDAPQQPVILPAGAWDCRAITCASRAQQLRIDPRFDPRILIAGVSANNEDDLRRAWESGDLSTVAQLALERYGREIFAVIRAQLRSDPDACEAFSLFAEALWRGLPGFQWRSTLRAWAYRIARNAAVRWATASERKPERNVPMDEAGIYQLAERVRSETLLYLQTRVKSAIRRLREELPQPDQVILILRVDKNLDWDEIAAALADEDKAPDEIKREAARLRKRFEIVTKKLRTMARERGLLPDDDDRNAS